MKKAIIILAVLAAIAGCTSKSQYNSEHPEYKAVLLSISQETAGAEIFTIYRMRDLEKEAHKCIVWQNIASYEIGDTLILRR